MSLILSLLLLLAQPGENIKVKEVWLRPSGKGMNSAAFFKIENTGKQPDTLYAVSSNISEKTEIHETYKKDDMMGMREVDFVVINPGATFIFKPRSHHVMFIKLKEDLPAGSKAEITFKFKQAGDIKINAEAKAPERKK